MTARVTNLVGFGAKKLSTPPATTVAWQETVTSTTGASITTAAGTLIGDFFVLGARGFDTSDPTDSSPSGWTKIATVASANMRNTLWVKICDANGANSVTVFDTYDIYIGAILMRFRGDNPFTSYQALSVNQEITDGNPAVQTITASAGTGPLIVTGWGSCYPPSGNSTPTMTPAGATLAAVDDTDMEIKTYNQADSPVNHTWDDTDNGFDNALISCYFELT